MDFVSACLGESVRGSKVCSESDEVSRGRSTSMNSPGHTVVKLAGHEGPWHVVRWLF